MSNIELLAIVEVSKTERVICRAPNCKHSVYKRIHVVKLDGKITVYGSECFKRLLGADVNHKPHYGSSIIRLLTPEERLLLIENTDILIARFEVEAQAAAAQLKAQATPMTTPPVSPINQTTPILPSNPQDQWQRRQLAREAWQYQHILKTIPDATSPRSENNSWDSWSVADWNEWAKRRLAGKAQWIDTPEALAAWQALTVTLGWKSSP